jgi:hypothetical protein
MSFKTRSVSASRADGSADFDDIGLQANWGERIVTFVAASVAVLIVVTIAVLMGMA